MKRSAVSFFIVFYCIPALFLFGPRGAYAQAGRPVPAMADRLTVGSRLPDFYYQGSGNRYWSNKDLQGKVTLINFFFIGCDPCMSEMRYLNLIQDTVAHPQFQVLGFARNTRQQITDFLCGNRADYNLITQLHGIPKLRFDIIPSCADAYTQQDDHACPYLGDSLGIQGFPQTILTDKNGIIRFVTCGFPAATGLKQPFDNPHIKDYFDKLRVEIEKLLAEVP